MVVSTQIGPCAVCNRILASEYNAEGIQILPFAIHAWRQCRLKVVIVVEYALYILFPVASTFVATI